MARLMVIALAALIAGCANEAPPPPPAPRVSVAQPIVRQVVDWDDYVGRFEAIEDVELRPRVSGTITGIYFRNGQAVRRGQPLFEIDPRPYRATLAQAEAQVGRAQAALANARSELARAEKLLEAQAFSREEYEARSAAVRTSSADLASARASADRARLDLGFTLVRAPIGGRVSDRRVSEGNFVSEGETVLTRLVSTNPIWFSFEGAEAFYLKYIRQDRAGSERQSSRDAPNPVEIQLADESGYRWRGVMRFVDNAIDPSSGTIRAHAVVQNPDGVLTPGMFGRARLLGSGAYTAMLVPDEAIVTDQTRKLAYVVGRDNKVVARPVETGPLVEGLRVVREGLAPTELVVLDGLTRLQPGMVVEPQRKALRPRSAPDAPVSNPVSAPPASEATAR